MAPGQGRNPMGGPLSALSIQSSTLANNLRVLARLYRWARETAGYDLDNHLTQGQSLRNREIESLGSTLRATVDGHALDTGAFDQHLAVMEDFLKWSLDSENRGGRSVLSLKQLTAGAAAAGEFVYRQCRNRAGLLQRRDSRADRRD